MFPLGEGVFGGFFGDHHGQHEGTHVSTGLCGRGEQAFMVGAKALGVFDADAEAEAVVGELRGKIHARIGGAGADQLNVTFRDRLHPAVIHLEMLALEIRLAGGEQVLQTVVYSVRYS